MLESLILDIRFCFSSAFILVYLIHTFGLLLSYIYLINRCEEVMLNNLAHKQVTKKLGAVTQF